MIDRTGKPDISTSEKTGHLYFGPTHGSAAPIRRRPGTRSSREQQGGAITNVSSIAAVCATPAVAYKTSKAGINAYTQSLALGNAKFGVRANVIMPGLMETPMAIEGISAALGIPKEKLIEQRHASVPLGGRMGTAWDVAWAAVFLASDEARFITGAVLPVDGGQSARVG